VANGHHLDIEQERQLKLTETSVLRGQSCLPGEPFFVVILKRSVERIKMVLVSHWLPTPDLEG